VNDLLEPSDENETLIKRMLKKHGDTLLEDGFYVKYGNHALDQSIALLEIGRALKPIDPERSAAFLAKAEERLNDYVGRSVDTQGVMNEQAVFYQWFNYHRYGIALDRLDDADVTPGPDFDRVALMPRFLAHATLPNGRYEMIGDTQDLPAYPICPVRSVSAASHNLGTSLWMSGDKCSSAWGRLWTVSNHIDVPPPVDRVDDPTVPSSRTGAS
jgi:hypothetical protein